MTADNYAIPEEVQPGNLNEETYALPAILNMRIAFQE